MRKIILVGIVVILLDTLHTRAGYLDAAISSRASQASINSIITSIESATLKSVQYGSTQIAFNDSYGGSGSTGIKANGKNFIIISPEQYYNISTGSVVRFYSAGFVISNDYFHIRVTASNPSSFVGTIYWQVIEFN